MQLTAPHGSSLHPEIKTSTWVTSNDCSILHMLTSSLQLGTHAVRESLLEGQAWCMPLKYLYFKRFHFSVYRCFARVGVCIICMQCSQRSVTASGPLDLELLVV